MRGQFSAGGRVDQHSMRQMIRVNVIDKGLQDGTLRTLAQFILPAIESQMPIGEDHLAAVHDAADPQVYAAITLQLFDAILELPQKRAAYQAGSDHADGKSLIRKIKGGMDRAQRSRCFGLFDNGGNIP